MTEAYRIFGSEMSPYSVKVRSWFRFKGLPHTWLPRNAETLPEYQKHAKLPLIPLVITPEGEGLQDSTPIIERLEQRHPQPSIHPTDPVTRFISELLEEFGDEWGNKWMFHFRWAREVDRQSAAGRIARGMQPDADEVQHAALRDQIRERMVGRVWFVGSNETTAPLIEASFREAITVLDRHLASRPYLLGARPSFGDFGLWGQLYAAWTDPTAGALIEGSARHLLDWIHRMLWPRVEGELEPWDALEPTLLPLLADQVGSRFLPWTRANARAVAEQQEEFSVELRGERWVQKPQKYHARSFEALREKYRALAEREEVDAVLQRAGCLEALRD
ncbi:MAG TPA: glutathione S-transferase family protein [Pseudomonadales bacterium]